MVDSAVRQAGMPVEHVKIAIREILGAIGAGDDVVFIHRRHTDKIH
jgi:hypothetical protein